MKGVGDVGGWMLPHSGVISHFPSGRLVCYVPNSKSITPVAKKRPAGANCHVVLAVGPPGLCIQTAPSCCIPAEFSTPTVRLDLR